LLIPNGKISFTSDWVFSKLAVPPKQSAGASKAAVLCFSCLLRAAPGSINNKENARRELTAGSLSRQPQRLVALGGGDVYHMERVGVRVHGCHDFYALALKLLGFVLIVKLVSSLG
jgi:hypothetical protein